MNLDIFKLKKMCNAHMIVVQDSDEWDYKVYDGKRYGTIQFLIFSKHEGKEFQIGIRLSEQIIQHSAIPIIDYVFSMFEREKRKIVENDN